MPTASPPQNAQTTGQPSVSVIMPVRNEEHHIADSLGAVLSQTGLDQQPQVIVVDGCSEDRTVEFAHMAAQQHGTAITVLSNPARTAPAALNLGLASASGDVIIRVDGHCQIPSDYFAACLELLERTGADCAGGVCIARPTTPTGRGIAAAMSSPWGMGGVAFRRADAAAGEADTVAFGAYRRDVFDRIGYFDEELVRNQDDEFNVRLTQSGGRIWLEPRLQIGYSARESLRGLARQFEGYGRYKVRVMQKRRAVPKARHLAPAALVGGLTLATVGGVACRRPATGPAVAAGYALTLTAAIAAAGPRDASLLRTAAAAATMHLAYGAGFWRGAWIWRHHFNDAASDPPRAPLGWRTEESDRCNLTD